MNYTNRHECFTLFFNVLILDESIMGIERGNCEEGAGCERGERGDELVVVD